MELAQKTQTSRRGRKMPLAEGKHQASLSEHCHIQLPSILPTQQNKNFVALGLDLREKMCYNRLVEKCGSADIVYPAAK